jgi:hypothetical protein
MFLNQCTDSANTIVTVTVIIGIGSLLLLYFPETLYYIILVVFLVYV